MGIFSSSKERSTTSIAGVSRAPHGSHSHESATTSNKPKAVKVDDKEVMEAVDDDEDKPKKTYAKEKVSAKTLASDEGEETETQVNTRLNAMLYHVNDDSVDMYKQENNHSDLLGRLYYDDYDSDSSFVPDAVQSPLMSPVLSPITGNDYFSTKSNSGFKPTLMSPSNLSRASSSTSLLVDSQSSMSSRSRTNIPRNRSFERGISFDTSTNTSRKSLTLKLKHPKFKFRRNNKTFLVGFNNDVESLKAIEWLFDEMIINGDTLIILQVLDEKKNTIIDKIEANKVLSKIEALNAHSKKISLVFEIVIGKPQKLLKKAIDEYSPAMMTIGSHHYNEHGNNHHKGFLSKASISKHFLECALVPVIIVKSTYQYTEALPHPIDAEDYFQKWIASTDINGTYSKDKHRRRNLITNALSPTSSRNGSSTNLAALERERGRPVEPVHGTGAANSQSYSHKSHIQLPGHRSSAPKPAEESTSEDRGRKPSNSKSRKEDELDGFKFFNGGSRSRSDSRSRSRSRSRSVNGTFQRLFGHKHSSPS